MRGMSTEDLTLALNNRIIDIALVRTITEEPLESTVNLTLPYYVVSQRIIMKVGPDATIENLRNGWTIGTVGRVFEENVRKVFPSANVRGGIPLGEAYQALLSGAVDAYSGDGASLDLLVSQSPDLLVIVGESIAYIPAYGLISKDNQEFLNEVNAAIQAIKEDGTWKNIHLKWFPSDEEPILPPDS
jgi:ABC-type amino acid transport substrate-binding protein